MYMHNFLFTYFVWISLQVFVNEQHLFTLRDIDHNLELLNLCGMDSDKPSPLVNADLSEGGTLKQHGELLYIHYNHTRANRE